ncbi:hypothetical protein LZ32DRAFT_259914 [Colletotrichum eremochloae]|nr:hypothetical protein LZ32DRAFT_259914 [Colletotrichum eremochloae]
MSRPPSSAPHCTAHCTALRPYYAYISPSLIAGCIFVWLGFSRTAGEVFQYRTSPPPFPSIHSPSIWWLQRRLPLQSACMELQAETSDAP